MKATITKALNATTGSSKPRAQRILNRLKNHPRMWAAVQATLATKYERATGKDAASNLPEFLDWLIKNLPAILSILAALLALI